MFFLILGGRPSLYVNPDTLNETLPLIGIAQEFQAHFPVGKDYGMIAEIGAAISDDNGVAWSGWGVYGSFLDKYVFDVEVGTVIGNDLDDENEIKGGFYAGVGVTVGLLKFRLAGKDMVLVGRGEYKKFIQSIDESHDQMGMIGIGLLY